HLKIQQLCPLLPHLVRDQVLAPHRHFCHMIIPQKHLCRILERHLVLRQSLSLEKNQDRFQNHVLDHQRRNLPDHFLSHQEAQILMGEEGLGLVLDVARLAPIENVHQSQYHDEPELEKRHTDLVPNHHHHPHQPSQSILRFQCQCFTNQKRRS